MTDVDYCTGENCDIKNLCTRFLDFIYRKEKGFDYKYPISGKTTKECPQYKQAEFYGG